MAGAGLELFCLCSRPYYPVGDPASMPGLITKPARAPAPRPPQTVSFVGGKPVFAKYMDSFPFPFYIVLRDTGAPAGAAVQGLRGRRTGSSAVRWQGGRCRRCCPCCCWRGDVVVVPACSHSAAPPPTPTPHPPPIAAALPRTLADLLRQWFELSSHG